MKGLKDIRKIKNLNQQKVAIDSSISREALSLYESGKRDLVLSCSTECPNISTCR